MCKAPPEIRVPFSFVIGFCQGIKHRSPFCTITKPSTEVHADSQVSARATAVRTSWSSKSLVKKLDVGTPQFAALHPDRTVNEGDGDFATPTRQSPQGSQSYQLQSDFCHLREKRVFLPRGPKILNSSTLGDYRTCASADLPGRNTYACQQIQAPSSPFRWTTCGKPSWREIVAP